VQNLYEGKLEIGGKGVIIATNFPENSYMIGWVVDIEGILDDGDLLPSKCFTDGSEDNWCDGESVLAYHPDLPACDGWLRGYGLFNPKHIMPLSGTFDEEFSKEENPYLVEEVA